MDTDKTRICVLFDIYGDLLPQSVAFCIDLYYNDDLSLSEAAENTGISRQGVRAALVRGTELLNDYEQKLGLYKKYKENKEIISKIKAELSCADEETKKRVSALLDSLSF